MRRATSEEGRDWMLPYPLGEAGRYRSAGGAHLRPHPSTPGEVSIWTITTGTGCPAITEWSHLMARPASPIAPGRVKLQVDGRMTPI